MQGDRDVSGTGRTLPFLGKTASFPVGPFRLVGDLGRAAPSGLHSDGAGRALPDRRRAADPARPRDRLAHRARRSGAGQRPWSAGSRSSPGVIRENPTQWYLFTPLLGERPRPPGGRPLPIMPRPRHEDRHRHRPEAAQRWLPGRPPLRGRASGGDRPRVPGEKLPDDFDGLLLAGGPDVSPSRYGETRLRLRASRSVPSATRSTSASWNAPRIVRSPSSASAAACRS